MPKKGFAVISVRDDVDLRLKKAVKKMNEGKRPGETLTKSKLATIWLRERLDQEDGLSVQYSGSNKK